MKLMVKIKPTATNWMMMMMLAGGADWIEMVKPCGVGDDKDGGMKMKI